MDKLKEKDEWGKELDDLLCHRINGVISEKGHLLWAMTTEEVVKMKLFINPLENILLKLII